VAAGFSVAEANGGRGVGNGIVVSARTGDAAPARRAAKITIALWSQTDAPQGHFRRTFPALKFMPSP
jgi:hypothetical protein